MRKVIRIAVLVLVLGFSVNTLGLSTTGLVAYWTFDEGSGDTAHDSTGTNNGTLLNGPVWTTGIVNGALEFDGNNDYVDVGYLGEFPTWTISLWADSDTQGTYHTFISQDQTSWNDDILFGICPQGSSWSTRDKIAVIFHRADYTEYVVEDNEDVQTGQWYNAIVTYDGSTMILYVNGIQKDSVVATDLVISDQRWTIGRNPHDNYPSAFRQFDGTIDEVMIFDRALSPQEIEELYLMGLPKVVGLEIEGPNEVAEQSTTQYTAIAVYDNNSTKDVTNQAYWAVMPDNYAEIDNSGLLTTDQLIMPAEDVTLYAEYEEGNDIAYAEKDVQILALCPQGRALDFDGEDDYVNLGTSDSIKPSLPLTLSAWINLSNLDTHNRILALDINIDRYYGVWFKVKTDNTLEISYGDGGGTNSGSRRSKFGMTELDKDIWYHVAAVIRGPENINLYIDGKDDGGIYSGSGGPLLYSNGFSSIGYNYAPHIFFYGNIDEVTIFNRGLSGEDIQTVMLYGPDTSDTSLVGYWKFDEGQGQVAHNSSGNANDGYLGSDPCNPDDSDPCWVEPGAPVHCTPRQIVVRNLRGAIERKAIANQQINEALERERVSIRLMTDMRGRRHFAIEIQKSMQMEDLCKKKLHESAEALRRALDWLLDNAVP